MFQLRRHLVAIHARQSDVNEDGIRL
jgi:hypothetical protein